ncbi:hypothetical protein B296_00022240 [Ensete ventricosum]|uniref:Uncharacterized protein n=1 Tax=Ensete ventricosum TaxID=4639 RepID=A0A426YL77_ENSVE|nr:hypothetical protein B296_00022240 [Ensete ventricosum]
MFSLDISQEHELLQRQEWDYVVPYVLHSDGRLILHGAKDGGSFKAHAPYIRDVFDRETKVIQLEKVKLNHLSTVIRVVMKEVENKISVRPCMGVAVCLFINQGKLLKEYKGVEAGSRKVRGSDDESRWAQLPKSKASVRKKVDSKKCHSAVEADLPIVKKGIVGP